MMHNISPKELKVQFALGVLTINDICNLPIETFTKFVEYCAPTDRILTYIEEHLSGHIYYFILSSDAIPKDQADATKKFLTVNEYRLRGRDDTTTL